MEENNLNVTPSKKQNSNIGLVILLVIIIMGLTGFIVYDKLVKNDKKEEQTNTPVSTATPEPSAKPVETGKVELTENDPTVQKLIKTFIPLGENITVIDGEKPTLLNESNNYRLIITYQNLDKSLVKKTTCANYELEIDNNLCGSNGYSGEDPNSITIEKKKNTETLVIKSSDLRAKYKELFGTNYEYKEEDFGTSFCVMAQFHYFKDKDEYVTYSYGSGCEGYNGTYIFKSAYKENDKLFIKTEFSSPVLGNEKKLYTYEFKLENGNYTFVKVVEE